MQAYWQKRKNSSLAKKKSFIGLAATQRQSSQWCTKDQIC